MSIVPAPIAAKLDASPRVVSYWRDGWKLPSVRWGAVGTVAGFIMAVLQAEAGVAGLFGIVPQWVLWCLVSFAAIYAIWLRLSLPKPVPPDDTDSMGDAGPLPK